VLTAVGWFGAILFGFSVAALVAGPRFGRTLDGRARRIAYATTVAGTMLYIVDRAPTGQQFLQFTIIGVALGCVYAVAASGLVLTYTTTGVFNFAHGAVGMISAYVFYSLFVDVGLPMGIALVLVLFVFAPLVGLLLELVMRRFKDASVTTNIVVTIALMVLLIGVAQFAYPASKAAGLPRLLGEDNTVTLVKVTLTYDQVSFLVVALLVAFVLRVVLFGTRMGTAMRAVVDNAGLAALNGAKPVMVARFAWMLGSMLAALAGVLLGAGGVLEPIVLTFLVTNAYGAAVFGRLKSLPLTFVGAIALGLAQNYALFALPHGAVWDKVKVSLPGIFLFAALLLLPEAKLTVGRVVGRQAPNVPNLRQSIARGVAFFAVMAVVVNVLPAQWEQYVPDMTRGVIYGLILLSLVVLTGFSGQVSLSQYVFVAIGAWAMGNTLGGSSIAGLALAGVAAVPFGIIVALPAIRLQGLYLALVTLGFAIVSKDLIFEHPRFFGKGNVDVGRLSVLGVDFKGDTSFFLLCTFVFAVAAIIVLALKRGSFGRRMAGMRDSQAACATLGLDVRRTKLLVFSVSAFIAGVAGALFGGLNATAGSIQFEPIQNIVLFLFAVVGGITTVSGALIGGALFALLPVVQSKAPDLAGLVFAAVAVGAIGLGRQPNGLAGMLYERLGRRQPVEAREPASATPRAGKVTDKEVSVARA
jgi:branched-chain amino acid transport system permease protein